ncbi:MAG: oligosaccharide flippase family protein [Bacteroidales bacterium]|nr:oligosaccharide flippase family protein [Bacteroidales bacterium]
MAGLGSLLKETAIYGLSSIVGRFLNYLLVPIYTAKLSVESGGYGIITNVYAYVALLMVLLTYGMETTFFRFANKEGEKPMEVYSTTLISVGCSSLMFVTMVLLLLDPISGWMGYEKHPEYIGMMVTCVAIDAFQAIPFAYLRYQKKAIKFAALKLLFIFMSILLNICYFVWFPDLYETNPDLISAIYNPQVGVGYAFAINLLCTASITIWFWPELTGIKYKFNKDLWKRMIKYSAPLVLLGLAGILNQTLDKIIYPFLRPEIVEENGIIVTVNATAELGIYGAASKIAMIMAMITQAFRFAYEPFVFGKSHDKDNKEMYAKAMKFFIIFTLLAFLGVMFYMDLIQLIIGAKYRVGLEVVPIVMMAEILMGVYFNLSFWYKLTDETKWGAIFSFCGCMVLFLVNVLFVPRFGYIACAWAGVAGYGTAMTLSYFVGQKKYPINYEIKNIFQYVLLTLMLYGISVELPSEWNMWLRMGINTLLLLIFIGFMVKKDFPLSQLPIIGKYFK